MYGNVFCEGCDDFIIYKSTFRGNKSRLYDNRFIIIPYLTKCFFNNYAETGGVLYIYDIDAKITLCELTNNTALEDYLSVYAGMRGGIFIHSEDFEYDISVEQTNFSQNLLHMREGILNGLLLSTETNNQYSHDTATYKQDRASYAYQLNMKYYIAPEGSVL